MISVDIVINNETHSLKHLLDSGEQFGNTAHEKEVIKLIQSWIDEKPYFEIMTSGSTGGPKLIKFSRAQIKRSIESTQKALRLKAGMTSLISLSTQYVAGMMMVLRSLEIGMNMVLNEPSSNPLLSLQNHQVINFAAFVPFQVETILANPSTSDTIKEIDTIIIGGAAVSDGLHEKIHKFNGSVYSTYGMTETLTHIALKKLTGPNQSESFKVLDGIKVEVDESGCLVIHTPVSSEPIVTTDVVELNNNKSSFKWLGRADFVINSGGIKIHPESVEKEISIIFNELNVVNRFLLIGVPDNKLGERSVLLIEGSRPAIHEEIKYALKHSLEKYLVPKEIHYLPILSYTDSDKLDRIKTKELFINRVTSY